jgi:hypothetical protein
LLLRADLDLECHGGKCRESCSNRDLLHHCCSPLGRT